MWDCSSDDSREMEVEVYPIEGEPYLDMQKHNVHLRTYVLQMTLYYRGMAQSKC